MSARSAYLTYNWPYGAAKSVHKLELKLQIKRQLNALKTQRKTQRQTHQRILQSNRILPVRFQTLKALSFWRNGSLPCFQLPRLGPGLVSAQVKAAPAQDRGQEILSPTIETRDSREGVLFQLLCITCTIIISGGQQVNIQVISDPAQDRRQGLHWSAKLGWM